MGLLWTLLIGFCIGLVAKFFMPGKDPGGIIVTILLGIGGSWLAEWLGRLVGFYGRGDSAGFIASVFGAILILWIYRKMRTT